jgi:hypothetical protein
MEESVVPAIPNELIVGLPTITLTAKGAPALWLVIPVSLILVAIAARILGAKWSREAQTGHLRWLKIRSGLKK